MRDVAKNNLKALGFGKEIENVENGKCPFCGSTETKPEHFRDDESRKEFETSGLCQSCIDDTFKKD
jgi:hypothetical protein